MGKSKLQCSLIRFFCERLGSKNGKIWQNTVRKMVSSNEESGHSLFLSDPDCTIVPHNSLWRPPCSSVGTPLSFCKQGLAELITNIRIAYS